MPVRVVYVATPVATATLQVVVVTWVAARKKKNQGRAINSEPLATVTVVMICMKNY